MPSAASRPLSNGTGERLGAVFGAALRQCRVQAGLTQEQLAHRSGISIRAISDLERNRTARPLMRSARMRAEALGLTGAAMEQFTRAAIGGDTDVPPPQGPPGYPADRLGLADSPPWAGVPRQLPAAIRDLSSRECELAALGRMLDEAVTGPAAMPVVVITGIAGAGKTALAVCWAREVAGRFADGQLYGDLGGFSAAGRDVPQHHRRAQNADPA